MKQTIARRPKLRRVLCAALAGMMCVAPLPGVHGPTGVVRAAQDEPVPAAVRDAVDKALEWLAKNQQPDGTFPQGGSAGTTAVPSLCVLAFLARGHVPGQGRYGEMLYRSIDYVLESQRQDPELAGLLSRDPFGNHVMYEHGISTVMLAEVYGMVDDARRVKIAKALAKSVERIIAAQHAPKSNPVFEGGWRYQVNSPDSDISVTGWQMMALRGAANCGAAVPKKVLQSAREYIVRSAFQDGGFGYQPGQAPNQARTGTGILLLELFRGLDPDLPPGEHPKKALDGGDYLLKNKPDNANADFYYYEIYYCSQAVNQLGGKYWDGIYPGLRDTLLAQQQPNGEFGGSNGQERDAGPAYRSAMACLALCVPYRYLPIYQADN